MTDLPPDLAVPLADVEIAHRIAEAARTGRPIDRTPTVEQLLAAFGEDAAAEPDGRARVARALAVAGVAVSPSLADASPGARVTLAPGPGGGGRRGGRGRVLLLGLLALVVLIGAAVGVAALTRSGDDGGRASALPPGTTATTTTATTSAVATTTAAATTTAVATAAEQAASAKQAKADRERARQKADAQRRATAKKRRAARARKDRAARRKRERKRAADAKKHVVVTLIPAAPTYLCVKDGAGNPVFSGTLSTPHTFKAKLLRMNIGLASVAVTVDGKPLALVGSPTGYRVQAGGKDPVYLPRGQRPEC